MTTAADRYTKHPRWPQIVEERRDRFARELAETAVHEATHSVLAVIDGGRVLQSSVTVDKNTWQIKGETIVDGLFDLTRCSYAGAFGQLLWRFGRPPSVYEVLGLLEGSDDARMLAGRPDLGAMVAPIVARCRRPIEQLTMRLLEGPVIRQRAVLAALGCSADPQAAAVHLANVRAGAAPRLPARNGR